MDGGDLMGVFRDISIPFGGRDYVVTPANRLLRMIEMKGQRDDPQFNLAAIVYRAKTGQGSMNALAFLASEFLNSAGAKTTEDHVFAYMLSMEDPKELRRYIDLICDCVIPEPKETKKPEAEAETKAA